MFRRGSSRAVSPKKEVKKAPVKVKSRDENTAPEQQERPKPVKRASVKDIYDEHNLTEEEIKKRHEKLGYDPLDKLLQSERLALNEKKSAWTKKRDRAAPPSNRRASTTKSKAEATKVEQRL